MSGMLIKSLATRRIQSRSMLGIPRIIPRNKNPSEISCGGTVNNNITCYGSIEKDIDVTVSEALQPGWF